ncbi:hypothetical protein [Lysinibacillus sp. LZ02]|uniref:hypothetical protein n=1 Tax=Lysinibacillus sp. LZ02 TaxID=3420668 RepID=UPI003D35B236
MKKIIGVVVGLLLLSIPWVWRFFEPSTVLNVAILDVSSNDEQLKERAGITEVLNITKITSDSEEAYDASAHYYGVSVSTHKEDITFNDFPMRYDTYDMIYLSNTYGIKEKDLAWGDQDSTRTLYSGLSNNAWRNIETRLKQKTPATLVVEQNSFNINTSESVQKELASALGISYSGWVAKYFEDLGDALEFTKEPYTGSGLVLYHEGEEKAIVLEDDLEVRVKTTSVGEKLFGFSTSEIFSGWMDISQSIDAEVLAYFDLDLTLEQQALLEQNNIPISFVAATSKQYEASNLYYLAGNFSEKDLSSGIPYFKGYIALQKFISNDKFYWHNYYAMLEGIIHETKHSERVVEVPVSVEPVKVNNLSYNARIIRDQYEVLVNGKWKPITIKGFNIGMAHPGTFPGEAGITEEEYARWFEYIGEMGANTVRVYTLHPPGFYNALKEYNETHENPIYVLHGVWIDEEPLEEALDVYGEPTDNFQAEIKRIVDVIHGNTVIEQRPGHAYGTYSADISQYVIGWMLGIEWYPYTVEGTNQKHVDKSQYNGQFFSTKDAAPFEIWLAEQFEFTAQYEAETYGWIRPFSFTNWVTTDLLDHPYEPSEQEDYASVNPNVIYVKNETEAVGQFAAYHVYPYYPDFLNYTPKYANYIDHRGDKNNYAAYLEDLHAAHRIPVLISEFGIPASRGLTHKNVNGWNQGFIAEDEQGEILVRLFEDILHEGMLGGLVFTWQDEWFKRTWNTMDLDNPDQRPYWSNAQTNEQQFGILSFDTLKRKVDGDTSDWFGVQPFYDNGEKLEKMYVDYDERYLYIRFDMDHPTFNSSRYPIIYFDTVANQGNTSYNGIELPVEADFLVELKDDQNSRIKVDAYYDIYQYQYGHKLGMIEFKRNTIKNSGQFNNIMYVLNKQLTVPVLNKTFPLENYETGVLRRGNANPASDEYDSLADYQINEEDGVVEIRIPWLLLNMTDPSRMEAWSDFYTNEKMTYEILDGIGIGMMLIENGKKVATLPDNAISRYKWSTWSLPESKERLKESYYILKEKFQAVE